MLSTERNADRSHVPQASGHRRDGFQVEAASNGAGRFQLSALTALVVSMAVPVAAMAQVPDEFLGKWSSDPNRCQQVNGEVDVLEMTKSGFDFYEIGCELGQSTPASGSVRFIAQCYKGGSPTRSGVVTIRRLAPGRIDVALQGFSWTSHEPELFHRCR